MLAPSDLRTAVLTLMQRGADASLSDAEFNELALRVFSHQFELNQPYQRFCERRGSTPATVSSWLDVPAVPTAAFKEVALVAGDAADARVVFRTSGTTRGAERRGSHYILDPALYEKSLLPAFRHYVLHDAPSMRMLALVPPVTEQPDSSLSYMISVVMRELGNQRSRCYAHVTGLDVDGLRTALHESSTTGEPVCMLGTSLAFAHLMDALAGSAFQLPTESRLMDTGGFKGEMRAYDADDLRQRYRATFGLPRDLCINEYGMTELCSQYYDADFDTEQVVKRGPPWLRARVVNPDSLAPMRSGEIGILQHFDLANLGSVAAVLTEDLAYQVEEGFVLLGRVPDAMPRGCSVAMDILLSDAKAG